MINTNRPEEVTTMVERCEDFPCCGHEAGDCDGSKYGSDEAIKARVYARMSDPDFDPYYDDI